MYRYLLRLATCALLLTTACRQQVIVYECDDAGLAMDASPDGGSLDARSPDSGGLDAGLPADTGVPIDSGTPDTGMPDTGVCDPFCFTGLSVSQQVLNVQELATLSPQVDAAPGVQWTTRIDIAEVVGERPSNRPAMAATDAEMDLSVNGTEVNFRVFDVVPWFFETKFTITVHVREVGRAFEQTLSTQITVRGNVIISSGSSGGAVYAVGSDGRPATGGGRFEDGALLDLLVTAPRSMQLSSDGTLLVQDDDGSPRRIKRFELTGPDTLDSELEYVDANQEPLFRGGDTTYAFTELADGRVVFPEYAFAGPSGDPKSRIMVWNSSGQFERSIWAPSPRETWRAAAESPDGKVLVADRNLDAIIRYDPSTWTQDGMFLDQLPDSPAGLLATSQALYIGGSGFIVTAPWTGGRSVITGLPNSTASWHTLAEYEGGRLLAARATQNSVTNVAVIENRSFVRWFRQAGGPVIIPYGVVYLR